MMTSLREMLVKIGFETDEKPLKKVEEQLEHIHHTLEFLAAAEVVRGVYELTERFAHFAEELHVAATSAGITVEAFQKLAFAAGQSAVTQDQLGMSMARLSRALYEARRGGAEAQKAFAEAGFSQDQIAGFKTGQDALMAFADNLKAIDDPIKKQALTLQLLGRGAINMTGFLSQGSAAIKGLGDQAEKMGAVLNEHQVEALVNVEHALFRVWSLIKTVGATIAANFAPSVETAINEFTHFYEINRKIIETNIRLWVWDLTYAFGFVWGIVKFVTQAFFDFAKSHQELVRRALEVIFVLGLFIASMAILKTVFGWVSGAFSIFNGVLKVAAVVWEAFIFLLQMTGIYAKLAAAGQWLLNTAMEAFAGVITFLESPLFLMVAALAAVTLGIQALWVMLTGGSFKDTWLGEMLNFGLGALKGLAGKFGLNFGGEEGEGKESPIKKGLAGSLLPMLQIPEGLSNKAGQLAQMSGFAPSAAQGGNVTTSITAPITIHVPQGTDAATVGKSVKEGVMEHLDRIHREAQRSLTPARAY